MKKEDMRKYFICFFSVSILLMTAGCSSVFYVSQKRNYSDNSIASYYGNCFFQQNTLTQDVKYEIRSFMSNLSDKQDDNEIIIQLSQKLKYGTMDLDRKNQLLKILSELCWINAMEYYGNDAKSMPYFISTAYYSYCLLFGSQSVSNPLLSKYDPTICSTLLRYNLATSEIVNWLKKNEILGNDSFRMYLPSGTAVVFDKPNNELGYCQINKMEMCANYTVNNAEISTNFGIGVPVQAEVEQDRLKKSIIKRPDKMIMPGTIFVKFSELSLNSYSELVSEIHAQINIYNPSEKDYVKINSENVPLIKDFITPFSIFQTASIKNIFFHKYARVFSPNKYSDTGIYMISPVCHNKIPVIFLQGLQSSPETWGKMVCQLQNDPKIRDNYQFFFYRYSSGNSILASAAEFRDLLEQMREELCQDEKMKDKFNHLVLIGHSMGGLICKTMILKNEAEFLEQTTGEKWADLQKKLSEEDKHLVECLIFPQKPYISRIIFLACPHHGAKIADLSIVKLLSKMITIIPQSILGQSMYLIQTISDRNGIAKNQHVRELIATGLDNLSPDNIFIQILANAKIKDVPYHSIIGNYSENYLPHKKDSIVDYKSSHLDGAESEIVVKSGHSVQKNSFAISEVRRILRSHLKKCQDHKSK